MKAIVFSGERGDPTKVLSLASVPKPKPGNNQVLIRVLLSPVHPSNVAGVTPGVYPGPGKGESPGSEGVGIIVEHGAECDKAPPVGTRVLVFGSSGCWCEYVTLSTSGLVPVPEAVASYNAAQFFVNPFSAYLMSTQYHKPSKGEYLIQTAAGSALGRIVIQLSKIYGFKTINVIRNEQNKDDLIKLGADEVICTDTENLGERVKAITAGQGVKYAIDCVGGEGTSEILKAMAFGGKILIFGQLDKNDIHFPSGLLVVKLLTIQGFWLTNWFKTSATTEKVQCIQTVMNLFATKTLDCVVNQEFELKDFAEAIKATQVKGSVGKVMIKCSQ